MTRSVYQPTFPVRPPNADYIPNFQLVDFFSEPADIPHAKLKIFFSGSAAGRKRRFAQPRQRKLNELAGAERKVIAPDFLDKFKTEHLNGRSLLRYFDYFGVFRMIGIKHFF